MNAKAMVAITFGLSSAGKSTVINKLIAYLSCQECYSQCMFLHLEVDVIETLIRTGTIISKDPLELQTQLRLAAELTYSFSPETIEKARQNTFEVVAYLLSTFQYEHFGKSTLVIFVDDNNLTKGIRKRYKKICRKYETGFAELYFSVNVEEAIARSQKRLGKVIDPQVIRNDQQTAELDPGPYTITVDQNPSISHLADQLTAVFYKSINRFREINQEVSKIQEDQPKSSLSEIEELLRAMVNDFIATRRKADPKFAGQGLISQLKKNFYSHLKNIHQANPQSDELTPLQIRSDFLKIIQMNFHQS